MRIIDTINKAVKKGIDPYKAVACEWDRCQPDEVSDERRSEVKRKVYWVFYGYPEEAMLP